MVPPFERLSFGDGEVFRIVDRAPSAERIARQAERRGVRGVLVVLDGTEADATARAAVEALSRRRPGLALALLLVEASGEHRGVIGGRGEDPDTVLAALAETAAQAALATAARGELVPETIPALTLPARMANRESAWRAAVAAVLDGSPQAHFVGLHIIGADAAPEAWRKVLDPLLPAPGRRPPERWTPRMVLAAVLFALLGTTLATNWFTNDLDAEVSRHAAAIRQGAASGRLSPPAVAALGDLAGLFEREALASPLVPASWSGGMGDVLAPRLEEQVRTVLVAPVQRRLLDEQEAIAADVERLAAAPAVGAVHEMERAAAVLRRLVAFDRLVRTFRLEAQASPRPQWEALAAWSAGAPVPLEWLDGAAGCDALAGALAHLGWRPARPLALVERVLTTVEERLAHAGQEQRLRSAVATAQRAAAVLAGEVHGTDFADALTELTAAMDALVAEGERLAQEDALEPAADAVLDEVRQAVQSAGLIDDDRWRRIAAARDLGRDRLQRIRSVRLESVGPVFAARNSAPAALVMARDALAELERSGIAAVPALPSPDLKALAMQAGSPDGALVAAAARRLRGLRDWRQRHEPEAMPLLERVASGLASRAAKAAMLELAAAYRPGRRPDGVDQPASLAQDLEAILAGLATFGRDRLPDAAWLVGLGAHRQIEAVDAAYERRNPFRLAAVAAEWDGAGPVFRVGGGRYSEAFRMGLDRLREQTRQAAPLLRLLGDPAVIEAVGRPRLVAKWTRLAAVAAAPENAAGYRALRGYAVNVLPEFHRRDCHRPERFPATTGLPDGPFTAELEAIRAALVVRCRGLAASGGTDPE